MAAEAGSDDEMMAMGDREEVGPNADIEMENGNYEQADDDEMQVRLGGGGYMGNDARVENNEKSADLAGQKRIKREYSEEGEDMDFEAIQQETGAANI